MDIQKETQEKISQLQMLEHNLNNFISQKQNFQSQVLEIDNALNEMQNCKGKVYKITGSVMFESEKESLSKELKEKRDLLDIRVQSLEKQEKALEERAKKLQAEVMEELDKHMKDGKSN
jgi:prefoldin beta subunit